MRYGAQVVKGELKSALLDGDTQNYDLDHGFSRHPIEEDGRSGIQVKLGQASIINHIRLLLWDRDSRWDKVFFFNTNPGYYWSDQQLVILTENRGRIRVIRIYLMYLQFPAVVEKGKIRGMVSGHVSSEQAESNLIKVCLCGSFNLLLLFLGPTPITSRCPWTSWTGCELWIIPSISAALGRICTSHLESAGESDWP